MKQYLVMVQHKYQQSENKWSNVRWFEDGHRYYNRKADAQKALKAYIKQHNKDFCYGKDGKRIETSAIGCGLAVDLEIDKAMDDADRVVAWKIKVREVTEWSEVESKEI